MLSSIAISTLLVGANATGTEAFANDWQVHIQVASGVLSDTRVTPVAGMSVSFVWPVLGVAHVGFGVDVTGAIEPDTPNGWLALSPEVSRDIVLDGAILRLGGGVAAGISTNSAGNRFAFSPWAETSIGWMVDVGTPCTVGLFARANYILGVDRKRIVGGLAIAL